MASYKTRLVCLALYLFTICGISGQNVEVRGYLGAAYYQGDLAPLPVAFSFSEGNLAWSLSVGMKVSKVFKLHTRFTLGKLIGDDVNASSDDRKRRNLNFQSPLREYALLTDINLNHWLKGLDKYGINLYYSTGIAVFHFEPQTILNGELVKLRTLGTEGQGLPGYPDAYSNLQISIPFGMGFSFDFTKRLAMNFEVMPRITFTDYIDDVSGTYVSTQELIDANRPITAQVANKAVGNDGLPIEYPTGTKRGDSSDNDWYFFAGLGLSYTFGNVEETIVPNEVLVPAVLPEAAEENKPIK